MATQKKLLVTGCGRSGTKYVSFLLRRHGCEVGHEVMRRDGAASWCMAVDCEEAPWGEGSRHYRFDQVFHQVRHPAAAIASATSFAPVSWDFIARHAPIGADEPPLLRAAKYWYHWNIAAEAVADWRYRIEDIEAAYPEFCERLGLTADPRQLQAVDTHVNTRHRGRLFHLYEELSERLRLPSSRRIKALVSKAGANGGEAPAWTAETAWAALSAEHPALFEQIVRKASDYGYDL